MTTADHDPWATVTPTDVELAAAYYPILLQQARARTYTTYGQLVEEAKQQNPGNEIAQNAIPVSAGKRLLVVRLYTSQHGLPDLACLVVNRRGWPGESYFPPHLKTEAARLAHWEAEKTKVFEFDWSGVSAEFEVFIDKSKRAVKPRRRIKRDRAVAMMAEYFASHKDALPASIRDRREQIIGLLMDGHSPEEAFQIALAEGVEE